MNYYYFLDGNIRSLSLLVGYLCRTSFTCEKSNTIIESSIFQIHGSSSVDFTNQTCWTAVIIIMFSLQHSLLKIYLSKLENIYLWNQTLIICQPELDLTLYEMLSVKDCTARAQMTFGRHINKSFGRLGKVRTIFSSTIKFLRLPSISVMFNIGNWKLFPLSGKENHTAFLQMVIT